MTAPAARDTVVSNASTRALIGVLADRGVDTARVLRARGLAADAVGPPGATMRLPDMVAVWDEAERVTDDWTLGLRAAACVPNGAFGPLDFVALTSASVDASLRHTARYLRDVHGAARMTVDRSADALAVEFDTPRIGEMHEHRSSEFTLAVLLHRSRAATGVRWLPTEVDLVGPRPVDRSPFERVLGTRIRFERPTSRLVLSRTAAGLPHQYADDHLCAHLRAYLEAAARPRAQRSAVAERCVDVLQTASLEQAGITHVARHMGMSVRNLQRALMAGGDTYRSLRDAVWLQRARTLRHQGHSATEVAAALGFSEPSAFHRAFRRWTAASRGECHGTFGPGRPGRGDREPV